MEDEKERVKAKIIDFIQNIDRLDILEYIFFFISCKFKAGD